MRESVCSLIVYRLEMEMSKMNRNVWKRTWRYVHPAKIQISLRIRAVWSESSLGAFCLDIHWCKVSWCGKRSLWLDCALYARFRRYVVCRCGSNILTCINSIYRKTAKYSENVSLRDELSLAQLLTSRTTPRSTSCVPRLYNDARRAAKGKGRWARIPVRGEFAH